MKFDDIYNNQRYFVNYAANMVAAAEQNLLKNKFVIQVENTSNNSEEDLQNYQKLKELGFAIAINCHDISALSIKLIEVADYIKIVPYKNTIESIKKLHVLNKDATLIAAHINDEQQLTFAKKAGCILYQGHYFKEASKMTEKIKSVEPIRSNYYKLLKLTCTDQHVDFQEISNIISSDPALSYRLLKMINSVEFRTKNQISSITMALSFVGEQRLKKWIALMSLRGITPDKPLELIRISLIRARFGELLAPHFNEDYNSDHVFMVGMLSLLHVALNKTQEELFEEISVVEDIRESLLSKTGKYSDMLTFFKNYEQCDWEEIAKFAKKNELSNHLVNESYIAATKWCNELMDER
jgi:EAL and modified HD-GYP domain-containing signal transduction protein